MIRNSREVRSAKFVLAILLKPGLLRATEIDYRRKRSFCQPTMFIILIKIESLVPLFAALKTKALRRIAEGATMIRTKGEGTRHRRHYSGSTPHDTNRNAISYSTVKTGAPCTMQLNTFTITANQLSWVV